MKYRIFIDGETGTTGLEIKKRLSEQGAFEVMSIKDSSRKNRTERLGYYNDADIVFLCLPDDESVSIVGEADPATKIIDASSAHRVKDGWTYGLPELDDEQKSAIKRADRISNPGCHATGYILLVRPLVDAGVISSDSNLSLNSLTGYSGGGKSMIAMYNTVERKRDDHLCSPGLYGLSQSHKHLPEMLKYGGIDVNPVFTPVVSDFYRGMLTSIPLHPSMMKKKMGVNELIDLYKFRYKNDLLITVKGEADVSENGFIYANGLKERDDLEIIICGNDERMTLVARYDNLGKGASGAAIQNMNIMLGLPEHQGLRIQG